MPSPFPGMNPYIEHPRVWRDFHERFIPLAAGLLARQVMPKYLVRVEEEMYIGTDFDSGLARLGRSDVAVLDPARRAGTASTTVLDEAPAVVTILEDEELRESYLQVLDRESRQLITVIELLSPANKKESQNRDAYTDKRARILAADVNLVEIDLLRVGPPMPMVDRPDCPYSVLITQAVALPRAAFWPIGLRAPLPTIPIPLGEGDAPARLDLRGLLDRIYDEAGYAYDLYRRPPQPPLAPADQAWADEIIRNAPPPSLPRE